MGRAKKKGSAGSGEFSLFDEAESSDSDSDEDLPKDEAGRAKIKQQYVELLGIRVQKLAGRILNRERINKTLEGVYFICGRCRRVCHNLDDGLVEDTGNSNNLCTGCHKTVNEPPKPAKKAPPAKKAARPRSSPAAKGAKATKQVKSAPKAAAAAAKKPAKGARR
ncbi:MAG TPA: hypothetical protein VEL28_07970 [Candidatus Binatia bacterium]|nr:hypothetical protein [Candidatus Binatia bacterium]